MLSLSRVRGTKVDLRGVAGRGRDRSDSFAFDLELALMAIEMGLTVQ